MYPFDPSGTPWKIDDVADARRLTNLVLFKKLKGHEVLHFLAQLAEVVCSYIRASGYQYFGPTPAVAQSLMSFAFCVDSSDLFYFLCQSGQPFSCGDTLDWEKFIAELIPYKQRFCRFLIPIINSRLKVRDGAIVDDYTSHLFGWCCCWRP